MFRIICILITSSISIGMAADEFTTDEEYQVYSDVLLRITDDKTKETSFVIYDRTSAGHGSPFNNDSADYLIDGLNKDVSGSLSLEEKTQRIKMVKKFQQLNRSPHKLENRFKKGLKVILVTKKEIDQIFSKPETDGWDVFYKKYPGSAGTIELSRVSFSDDMTLALVYFGNQRHFLAGIGYYVLLRKEADGWKMINSVMAWMS